MKVLNAAIPGILVITPVFFSDNRGYFFESYHHDKYFNAFGAPNFVQDNTSRSARNTIRGLHCQVGEYAQGKLCQVVFGRVLDVAVDIRHGSPYFGKHVSFELSDENGTQLYIPPGFAHGFSVLSEIAIFSYKCTQYYSKNSERTLLYNDPDLCIDWKIGQPNVSLKDQQGVLLKNLDSGFVYP